MEECQIKQQIAQLRFAASLLSKRAKYFSLLDWGLFKLSLVSAGLLGGICFFKFFKRLFPIVFLTALISCGYTLWRLLVVTDD